MLTFFCHGCWKDFREDLAQCPHCGLDIHEFLKTTDFVDKLILALDHPEEETAIRAAWILGNLREPRAVGALGRVLATSGHVYLAGEAAAALGKIGTAEARSALQAFVNHPAQMVRDKVREVLGRLTSEETKGATDGKSDCVCARAGDP